MTELTNIFARSIKDLTLMPRLPDDLTVLAQVKVPIGNLPVGLNGCEALSIQQLRTLVYSAFDADIKVIEQHVDSKLLEVDSKLLESQELVDSKLSETKTTVDSKLSENKNYTNQALSNLSTQATRFYPTLAEANAAIAYMSTYQPVQVGEYGANGGLWYKLTAGSQYLTKSPYDPLTQARNYTDEKTTFWQVKDVQIKQFDAWSPYAVGFIGLNKKMPFGIRKDGVTVAQKMITDDLETLSQTISDVKVKKFDPFTGYVFGIGNGRKYPLLIDTLGALHSEKIKVNSLEVKGVEISQNTEKYSHVTQEWWVYPVHVCQSKPYPRVLSGMYSEKGEIVLGEYVIGTGVTNQFVIGSTPLIDDHNSPSVCANDGKRTVVTWTRHDATNMIYMKYSSADGDIRTLEYSELFEIDCGSRVTYTQAHFIESRSTDDYDIYWIFYRTNNTQDWRIVELKFVGESFEVLRHIPLLRAVGQYYISTSLSGNTLRIASGYNPAHPNNTMHYFEISTTTGEIKGMNGDVLGNIDQLDTLPIMTTSVAPVLPQAITGKDRRLHYVRPAPSSPAIAYAEWDLTDTDNATYKVVSLENGEWIIRDVAQAGKRFGYTPEANYISGISFPDPCFKDEVLITRYDNDSNEGVLERAFLVNDNYVKKESARVSKEHFLRPISPKNGGNICLYTHLYEYGKTSTFSFVSDIKLIFMK